MAGKIKKLKVKESTGDFGDYISLGADAANVDLTNGQTVEDNINYINTELLVARDVIDGVTESPFVLPIASDVVLGGIKIGKGLSIDENGVVTVESVTDYNDLINTSENDLLNISSPHITGSYTGDGESYQTISLDFTPSAVIIVAYDEITEENNDYVAVIAIMIGDRYIVYNYNYTSEAIEWHAYDSSTYGIRDGGFRSHLSHALNSDGEIYNYIAFI